MHEKIDILVNSYEQDLTVWRKWRRYVAAQDIANRRRAEAERTGNDVLADTAQRHQEEADDIWNELDEIGAFG